MRLMFGTLRLTPAPGVPFPPLRVFNDAGTLTFEQLASLRHRGAFSTVSLTFSTCCQLTQKLRSVYPDMAESDNLLREWYQGTLNCILTQASTTRRSAGIPSLVAAVLSANAESPSLAEVFQTLGEIGSKPVRQSETDGSNLPQVHALNSLREIFRSSLLSKRAESYLAGTLQLAANSLKSEVWAIRNCGLLLLRSLIDSLLGTGESKASIESGWDGVSIRISYNKYPTLPGVILGLLQSADEISDDSQNAAAEAVFPALDIIRRAGPPEENRAELFRRIEGYLGSHLWHVREIAARTLCSFLLQGDWVSEIERLLAAQTEIKANRLHGVLLTTRFVIERKVNLGGDVTADAARIKTLLKERAQNQRAFWTCPVIEAAQLEIFNLLSSLNNARAADRNGDAQEGTDIITDIVAWKMIPRSALLDMELAIELVHDTASSANVAELRALLLDTLDHDTNTASRLLETIPSAWKAAIESANPAPRSGLSNLYIEVCCRPNTAPEARAQALLNLGSMIDETLKSTNSNGQLLPSIEQLDTLWSSLQKGDINPTLSYAIIETSGSLMAATLQQSTSSSSPIPKLERRIRSWGAMIADALGIDNTFDTRFAAATALKSFFSTVPTTSSDAMYLPVLSALYDALIDDDDEVREAAAAAAAPIIGQQMVAPSAADRLAQVITQQFSGVEEFKKQVVCRMTGTTAPLLSLLPDAKSSSLELVSAETQFLKAMDFDDSLFATEEQNLFIDEVRETRRWAAGALQAFTTQGGSDSSEALAKLTEWVEEGLKCLVKFMREEKDGKARDGPLGWTSDQHVFAVVARVLLCAGVVAGGGDEGVKRLLDEFRTVGVEANVHGLLMEMAGL